MPLNAPAQVVARFALSRATRAAATFMLVLLICSIALCPACSFGSAKAEMVDEQTADPSVTCLDKLGLSGTITSNVVVGQLTNDGPSVVLVGTSDGLYAVSDGTLVSYTYMPFGVSNIALLDDIGGDGVREVVFSLKGADTPSIQCYNGATWERLWQRDTTQPVYAQDMGWSELQLATAALEVLAAGDSQIVAVSTGCCVFGIDASDGRGLWTFAARDTLQGMASVSDLDGDRVDDLVVGDRQGIVHLISGRTGAAAWSKKIAQKYQPENGEPQQTEVTDVAEYDRDAGKVVVAAGDGKVRLLDLRSRRSEWEYSLVGVDTLSASLFVSVVPDVTSDGEPEVLVTDFTNVPGGSTALLRAAATLLRGSGEDELWQAYLYTRKGARAELACYEDQPVILDPQEDSAVRLLSLKDGSLLGRLNVSTLDEEAVSVSQFTADTYVVVSSGSDLAVVSASGAQQWHYPRLAEIGIQEAQFTGDSTPDLLLLGQSPQLAGGDAGVRILSVVDGASHREVWRNEVPCSDLMTSGGLSGVQLAADLTGDGIRDILAYQGIKVFLFSGANGSLARFDAQTGIAHVQMMRVGSSNAVLTGAEDGVEIATASGSQVWSTAWADWDSSGPGAVRAVGDLNSDNVTDLAMVFSDNIAVLNSAGTSPLVYAAGRSIAVADNRTIEFCQMTDDIDGDSIAEIAYFEYDRQAFLDEGTRKDDHLLVVSPSTGKTLLRLNLDREVAFDLACDDFNGDGVLDSLVCWGRKQGGSENPKVEVYSGRDGSSLWTFRYQGESSLGTVEMSATAIGDATGDGIADLALSESLGFGRVRISVCDIARSSLVRQITIPPLEEKTLLHGRPEGLSQGPGPGGTPYRISDLDGDGTQELAIAIYHSVGTSSSGQYTALIDIDTGSLLALFPFSCSGFFETGEADLPAVAASAGLYLLRTDADLGMASPGQASTVGSPATLAWEGATASDFADVFVDGVRTGAVLGTSIRLALASGEHEIVVRSIDEYGKVTYVTTTFRVRQWPVPSIIGIFTFAILLLVYCYARCARVLRNRRAQKDLRNG